MSPRKRDKNEQMCAETPGKIHGAALIVFSEYGYYDATMKQIARVAGLSYRLVYHYFPSKEKNFRNLLDSALEIPLNALAAIFDGPGAAWKKIENLSVNLVNHSLSGEGSLYFFFVL
jgi:AcrR family transcriptional regulator